MPPLVGGIEVELPDMGYQHGVLHLQFQEHGPSRHVTRRRSIHLHLYHDPDVCGFAHQNFVKWVVLMWQH